MDVTQVGMFLKVNIAAQRARQLMQGAAPKIQTKSRKAAAIAIEEVESGAIEAYSPEELPEALRAETFGTREAEGDEDEG